MNSPAGFTPEEERELARREAFFEDLGPLPSSAQLAAFRFDLSECRHGDKKRDPRRWRACPMSHPFPGGGAWPEEREHGIGFRMPDHPHDPRSTYRLVDARRMAARQRSDTAAFLFANLPDGQP